MFLLFVFIGFNDMPTTKKQLDSDLDLLFHFHTMYRNYKIDKLLRPKSFYRQASYMLYAVLIISRS